MCSLASLDVHVPRYMLWCFVFCLREYVTKSMFPDAAFIVFCRIQVQILMAEKWW